MKAHGIHIVECLARRYLLFRQPFFIGKAKLQFVAVLLDMFTTEYWRNLGKFHLANTGQDICHLLLFVGKLLRIGKNLPFATATNTIMLTERLATLLRILMNFNSFGFSIRMLLSR